MSRTVAASKRSSSRDQEPVSSSYKLFVWDVGTDSRETSETRIRTLAALEYSSQKPKIAHFSTAVRPSTDTTTTKHSTPTFPDAWHAFSSFISDLSHDQPPLLVSHNAAFDVTVLLTELRRAKIKLPSTWRFACSLLFARSVHPFAFDNSQLALAVTLGVVVNRPHHTSEDVIVLRDILMALDRKALQDNKPANRVIPALCLHARKPTFFDRTPQASPASDDDPSPKFFITNTGTKYHREGCKWLHRSKIPRETVPPGFKPCRFCRPDDENYVIPDKSSASRENKVRDSKDNIVSSPKQVFITKTGTKYHVEGCKWLARSKIPKDTPPEGFKPCRACIKDGDNLSRPVRDSSNSRSAAPETSEGKSSRKAPFYVTKTGTKYHVEGCKSLRRSGIPKTERPSGYEACGICFPNIVYNGAPQVKSIPT